MEWSYRNVFLAAHGKAELILQLQQSTLAKEGSRRVAGRDAAWLYSKKWWNERAKVVMEG